jgi:hypothetical protein
MLAHAILLKSWQMHVLPLWREWVAHQERILDVSFTPSSGFGYPVG